MTDADELPFRLATAALIGLIVGLEREWSGHAIGPHARFAGLRTFFLIGLTGGLAGLLANQAYGALAAALVVSVGALSVAAYVMSSRESPTSHDGTTEVAAIAVLGLGTLAGIGHTSVAAGAGAIMVLMLGEKARLHWLVQHIAPEELEGALQFAVLALVILPIIPAGPYGGILDIRPRVIWSIVLLFSALNYCGYVARRVLGASRGYGATGLLGGLVSSTAVTLHFSRQSRREPLLAGALAIGVIGACTVLIPRVIAVSAFINPAVALALLPRVVLAAVVGTGIVLWLTHRRRLDETTAPAQTRAQTHDVKNPLALLSSLRMALAFQVAVSLIAIVRAEWGLSGVYVGAVALGFTDVDALTVSAARSTMLPAISAQAIVLGVTANTVLKIAIAWLLGRPQLRRLVVPALMATIVANVISLAILWGR